VLGHPNLVPTIGFAAPMAALIHLSERWRSFGISTLRYSRGPPTYSHSLNDARTLHCSSRAGNRGSVDRAMEAYQTNGVLSSDQRRSYHRTNQSGRPNLQPQPPTEIGDRPRDAHVSFLGSQRIGPCSRFEVVFIHLVCPTHHLLHK
jgi:hypothetical protein